MAIIQCPHCRGMVQDDGSLAATIVACPHCNGQFRMPGQAAAAPPPRSLANASLQPAIIKAPLLVSAIGNVFVALIWLSTCFLFFFAVPLIVLCVFEFRLYLKADTLSPREFVEQSNTLAIAEVICGLVNTISLVCGIIILVNVPAIKRRLLTTP